LLNRKTEQWSSGERKTTRAESIGALERRAAEGKGRAKNSISSNQIDLVILPEFANLDERAGKNIRQLSPLCLIYNFRVLVTSVWYLSLLL
jgi:hypothetical protein